jgi:hypothetical protein
MLYIGAHRTESCVGALEEKLRQTHIIERHRKKMKRIVVTAVAVFALLALPSAAFATGSSTCSSYNPQLCQIVNSGNVNTPSSGTTDVPTTTQSSGSLPFTGLDLGLLAAGGAVLIGAGLAARKLSAPR